MCGQIMLIHPCRLSFGQPGFLMQDAAAFQTQAVACNSQLLDILILH
jgi:hypothetical protein